MNPESIARIQARVAQFSRNGIVITDKDERIRWVNEGFCRLSGYTFEEALGQVPGTLLQGSATEARTKASIRQSIDKREHFDAKILNYSKSGQHYWIEISADPVFDEHGAFDGYVAIQYDVSEREAVLHELQASRRALARINEVILNLSSDFQYNLQQLTQLAGELLQGDCALYNRMEGDYLVSRGTWQTPPDYNPLDRPDGHLCFDVIRSADGFLYVPGLQSSTYAKTDPNVTAYGLKTYIGHQVKARQQSIGSLCVVFARDVPLTETGRQYLSLIAQAIGREELLQQSRSRGDLESSRLLTLLQSLDGALLVEDRERTIHVANEGLRTFFGADPEALLGRNCGQLIGRFAQLFRYPEAFVSSTESLIHKGVRRTGELLELAGGGWVERDFLPVKVNATEQGVMWHYRDATEKVRMVRVLDAVASVGQAILRRRLEGAAWQVPLEILGQAVEPDRVYVFHNHPHPQTQEPACSQTAEWVAGGVAAQIDLPDLQNICWKDFSPRWQQTLSAGQALFGEVASFPASERDLLEMQGIQSILVVPIFSREQWWGFMGFDYCRRTRKWLSAEVALLMSAAASIGLRLAQQEDENRLKQAMESANAANAAKSRFLSTMSHEIRTPLNSILGYTQLLRRNNQLNPPERVQLETIYRSGQHLLTLINDILDISKIEAGRVNLNASEFDLRDFAQEVMEMLQARASAKGIATRISISVADRPLQDNQSLLVRADIKALRQVLVNLVGNAVKFTDQGEVALEIYVEQKKSAVDCVTFRVVDSGIGIPQQELGRLFAAFSQLHHDNRGEHGTGLGLAIAKGMIELMHGTIEVESRENHGSVFYFTIPMPCKLVERVLPALCNSPIAAGPEVIQGYIGKRRSVLIVDDVMENRALLSDLLKPLGFQLTEATNGREALAMLNNSPFDVVLTDIVMPFMDGREFARQAKRLPAIAGIPIIAITASVIQDARNRNPADACFSAFVRKPVNLDELLRVMEEQLELEWDTSRPVAAQPLPVTAQAHPGNSPLSLSQLRRLYELASIGDVDALRQQLSTHSSQHPQVIEPLIDLLNHYALNAICKRLEERLHKATS